MMTRLVSLRALGVAACVLMIGAGPVLAQEPQSFDTAQDALETLIAAAAADDGAALLSIFGAEAADLVTSGNPDRDANVHAELLALYGEGFRFVPEGPDRLSMLLGAEGWPFPVPLMRTGAGWQFDIDAGRAEVLFRRIGVNEIEAIETLQLYGDIQAAYRLVDHDGDGVMEFAAHLLSTEGARDGLFWADADSPVGERIALADLDGYADGEATVDPEPFGGYYYRILTGQGPTAPGGEMGYLFGGNMVAGHALLATPSDYGVSGIMSFMVGENGTIYEADLGEDGLSRAQAITVFDPDDDWQPLTP